MSKLNELIDIVEKDHGPDHKLDSLIVSEIGLAEKCPYWLHSHTKITPMRLTSSLSAVQSLFDDLMPDNEMIVSISRNVSIARVGRKVGGSVEYFAESSHRSETRARLAAILKAVEFKLQKDANELGIVVEYPGHVFRIHGKELWSYELSSLIKHEDEDNFIEQDASSIADNLEQLREMRKAIPELVGFSNQLLLNLWSDFSGYWLCVGHESNYSNEDFLRYVFSVIVGGKREISFGSPEAKASDVMANSLIRCRDLKTARNAARAWLSLNRG